MGRKGKTLDEHLRDGTYRPDRHGHLTAPNEVTAAPPAKPAGLSPAESAKWDRLVAALGAMLAARDGTLLVELVRWSCRADQLSAALAAMNPEDRAYSKMLVNAAIAADKLTKLAAGFGMSPAGRVRLRQVAAPSAARSKVATRPVTTLDMTPPPENRS